MSTRCRIGKLNADGTVTSVYCHYDGYPTGDYSVGHMLNTYHNKEEEVDKIMSLGDISSLGKYLEPTDPNHSFDTPQKDVTVAYGRDRGEDGVEARVDASEKDYFVQENDWDIEYKYLWKDGKWEYK